MARFLRFAALIICVFSAGRAYAAGGACPSGANYTNPANPIGPNVTLASLGITNCYYVAANGSDSNSGTSESSPWLHAPQMPNCSGSCAAVQNQSNGIPPGTGIILRGGDTWHFGNSAASPNTGGTWNFNSGQTPAGTITNPLYIGVDQTWFSGGTWARPILTGDNRICGPNSLGAGCTSAVLPGGAVQYYVPSCSFQMGNPNNMIDISGQQYYIIDNFEMTGLCQQLAGQPSKDNYLRYGSLRNSVTFENLYIHGWTHIQFAGQNTNAACTTGVCVDIKAFQGSTSAGVPGDVLRFVVVDGADSDPEAGGLCFKGFYDVAYSAFRYTGSCLPGSLHTFHDNLYEYFYEDGHSDMLAFSEDSGVTDTVYNNVFRHIDVSGAIGTPVLWPNPPANTSVYIFNNLIYDVGHVEYINIGNVGKTYGTHFIFSNTFQSNVSQPILRCDHLTGTLNETNNHYIVDSSSYFIPSCTGTVNTTSPLLMTNATATTNGYASSQTYAYSPTSSGSPTVRKGTNVRSYCSALSAATGSDSALSDAAAACGVDTGYACTYNASNHTVSCPGRIVAPRPTSAAWNIGAYQFGPNPPSNLAATVQ